MFSGIGQLYCAGGLAFERKHAAGLQLEEFGDIEILKVARYLRLRAIVKSNNRVARRAAVHHIGCNVVQLETVICNIYIRAGRPQVYAA